MNRAQALDPGQQSEEDGGGGSEASMFEHNERWEGEVW